MLKMSVRLSVSRPRACSGLMKWTVPITSPAAVRRSVVSSSRASDALVTLARPKSSTFTCPRWLMRTFWGLMSR